MGRKRNYDICILETICFTLQQLKPGAEADTQRNDTSYIKGESTDEQRAGENL